VILANARIATADRVLAPGWLVVGDGRIAALDEGTPPAPADQDLAGRLLVPGFVDMHAHGAVGRSFDEADPAAAQAITRHHLAHGTTTMVASLVSAPIHALADHLRSLAPLVESGTLAGVHLEGPFLAASHRGAHDPRHLQPPTPAALEALFDAAPGALRMITLAPELPGARDAIKRLRDVGVIVAIGHTAADYETVRAAIDAGARVATHLHNGMPPIRGREPGPVPALLDDERVTVELIADGFHLHPAVLLRAALAAPGRIALVTDAMAAAGWGDGEYLLGGRRVLVSNGEARLVDADSLAGSTLTLDLALQTAVAAGIEFSAALAAVTSAPARALGIDNVTGTIAPGRLADLVALDDDYTVHAVMHRGRWLDAEAWPSSPSPTTRKQFGRSPVTAR
jgi:N-acetylglucosamine-6-phosphate deacetylase